jgi:hypothetical protein
MSSGQAIGSRQEAIGGAEHARIRQPAETSPAKRQSREHGAWSMGQPPAGDKWSTEHGEQRLKEVFNHHRVQVCL